MSIIAGVAFSTVASSVHAAPSGRATASDLDLTGNLSIDRTLVAIDAAVQSLRWKDPTKDVTNKLVQAMAEGVDIGKFFRDPIEGIGDEGRPNIAKATALGQAGWKKAEALLMDAFKLAKAGKRDEAVAAARKAEAEVRRLKLAYDLLSPRHPPKGPSQVAPTPSCTLESQKIPGTDTGSLKVEDCKYGAKSIMFDGPKSFTVKGVSILPERKGTCTKIGPKKAVCDITPPLKPAEEFYLDVIPASALCKGRVQIISTDSKRSTTSATTSCP